MSRKQIVFAHQINSLALDTVLVCQWFGSYITKEWATVIHVSNTNKIPKEDLLFKKKQDKKLSDNFVRITVGVIYFSGAANMYTFLYKEPGKMFFWEMTGVYTKHKHNVDI